ncbi:hypothetical protein F2P81_002191 [Scophthalmus maximus]|uniref:Ankyrin repeat domain-containing protein 10-like n=1 Tax=Scophthalmus maximus TaxID=52904 RepID=A0A6A4TUI5_SCOMX|nr:hypothetical protein F2P81_002191 [Scophthalmus maximus]
MVPTISPCHIQISCSVTKSEVRRVCSLALLSLSLRNASGQTAADLAHAHGFLDCFRFVSNPQEHLLQPDGLRESGVQNGSGPWGQGSLSRKRLPASVDSGHTKKARRAEDVLVQVHGSGAEEVESMSVEESAQELGPGETEAEDCYVEIINGSIVLLLSNRFAVRFILIYFKAVDDTKGVTNGHHQTLPRAAQDEPEPPKTSPPPANRPATAVSTQRSSPDMCGSLHLTGSPSSCVSQRPAWWGLMGADCRDFQHYGHYHGFGDTAEELSDSGHVQYGGIQAEHRYKQAVAGTVHLYHSS